MAPRSREALARVLFVLLAHGPGRHDAEHPQREQAPIPLVTIQECWRVRLRRTACSVATSAATVRVGVWQTAGCGARVGWDRRRARVTRPGWQRGWHGRGIWRGPSPRAVHSESIGWQRGRQEVAGRRARGGRGAEGCGRRGNEGGKVG